MTALALLRDGSGTGEGCRGSAGCLVRAVLLFLEGLPNSKAEEGGLFKSCTPPAISVQSYAGIKAAWACFL